MAIFTRVALIIYGLAWQVIAAPTSNDDKVTGTASSGIPPLITFKDGNIGVNFLGFKASAGLGGLLTGDASQGGLHAEAGTPFGQRAAAGLGGTVGENGRSIGGLYAGATAGGGIGASAGLDGTAGEDGSFGRSYAGASAGNVGKTVIKETYKPAPGSVGAAKIADVEVVKEYSLSKTPVKSKVDIEVVKEIQPQELRKTYVERTIIPNYVEKTVQVPSYVEKTIRVPTVVEKRIKVPAPPTIIEKEVEVPQPVKTVVKTKQVADHEPGIPAVATVVKTKTKIRRRPWVHLRNRINLNSGENKFHGGVVAGGALVNSVKGDDYVPVPLTGTYTTTVRKQFNGDLVRDIFNIPIATLGAVSNLVGNIAGGVAGSASVSKSISTQ